MKASVQEKPVCKLYLIGTLIRQRVIITGYGSLLSTYIPGNKSEYTWMGFCHADEATKMNDATKTKQNVLLVFAAKLITVLCHRTRNTAGKVYF